jgi:hypothetical protein
MRLLRIQYSSRKTVIYHPSLSDIAKRLRCVFGQHDYETVLEYQSVGAKEEMCIHCMKQRYHVERAASFAVNAHKVA